MGCMGQQYFSNLSLGYLTVDSIVGNRCFFWLLHAVHCSSTLESLPPPAESDRLRTVL